MLFGRRKPGYTTTVDSSVDPEQAVLDLQKAELAAKKKPKAEVFDIDAASETARRLKETGSSFDGSAAKTGEDVIAAVERVQKENPALHLNSFVTVADATKVKVYMKNFGEFYNNQIESADPDRAGAAGADPRAGAGRLHPFPQRRRACHAPRIVGQ